MPATWVALPESTEELAAVLRACAERGLAAVPVGGGTKLDWGGPPERCDVLLDLCCLDRVLEHAAGDLVVRVQAGLTLDRLAAALAAAGQELALDLPLPGATVGGTLATGLAGPRALRYGTPRDLLIGITVVLADGTIARSGGKVVKNVAGYDLGKLFTGSYGTLGVIAEATFRLHPLPQDRRWLVTRRDPREVFPVLAAHQAEPSAITLDWPEGTVTVLVEGAAAEARAQALRLEVGGDLLAGEPAGWAGLDEPVTEVRTLPTGLPALLDALGEARTRLWLADHLVAYTAAGPDRLHGDGRRVRALGQPQAAPNPLLQRVKERFDPGRVLAPGRLLGGF
ncbi:FAD-binding oxidoreductase [Nonomuraea sp. NPDC050328]|uniref:FAD-binding oxidoreductase n=1 Tax=Nonomuraea sp. NPDC050328 TaxID=3364361 RepID=UPI00379020F4